jgi:hypothetical protein
LALKSGKGAEASEIKGGHTIPLTIIKIVTKDLYKFFEKLLNCMLLLFCQGTFIEAIRNF